MKSVREHIYLAALLHDIGKFYQRADKGSVRGSEFLKEHCKDESTFCPVDKNGRYSHKHVLWTAQFIEDFAPVFKKLVNDEITNLTNPDNLINLSAGHHLKNEQLSNLSRLIKEADCLSSGMDRTSLEAMKDEQDESEIGWDAFKKKRMIPILQTIGINIKSNEWKHLPVDKTNLSKSYFPKDTFGTAPDYSKLWSEFKLEFEYIQANTYRAFAETLLNLLYKYTSTVPSSTINFPDVSLYDHLKTTAALAVCLYDYQLEENKKEKPFLLIGADFSGIQSYIYQIVSKYAGKNLKGRSYYLRILSDSVVRYLLKELHLFQANVIYNSGGGFYLLAPNTSFVREALSNAIKTIEHQLFQTHGTSLFVAIDSVELSREALMHQGTENLGEVWGELFIKRDRKKSTKFAECIKNDYQLFFEPTMMGGEAKRDSITGEEFLPNEKIKETGGLLLKEITASQIEMGKKLRETNLLVVKEGSPLPYWKDRTHIEPTGLGFIYYFLNSEEELKEMKDKLSASADEVSVITMNGKGGNCDFLHTLNGINNIYGLEFYGGNEIDQKNIPTFEDMCKNENDNFSRLGVLRMDVDNLGLIFQKGIPAERATLSRYAALSRSFDYFFSGYLNTIWREVAPERSFIIYSGGDDVFIVGSWDVTIELAERIKKDFSEYTCGNPAFSLSGGIAILSPKYPIMKGAEESAKEESAAKNHSCQGATKNSISFMDMPLNWDMEYKAVKNLKTVLYDFLMDKQLPKSFLSKVLMHHANAGITNHKVTRYKTYWMLTYDLSRMKNRYDKSDRVNALIENCIKEVCNQSCGKLNGMDICTDYHPLELWAFAARWAELEYRKDKE